MTRLLIALAVLAISAPAAEAKPPRQYDVSVEATHFVGWRFLDPNDPQECFNWERASGDEVTRIETSKPGRLNVFADGERGATAFLVRYPKATGEYERESTILRHTMPSRCTPCGPSSEYGPCGPDPVDERLEFRCGPKTSKAVGGITIIGGKVTALLGATFPSEWDSGEPCPVPVGGPSKEPVNRQLPNLKFPRDAWKDILRLRRGRRVVARTVEFRNESGAIVGEHCGDRVPDGYSECARTAVKLTVRRLR
jgi:hypothetical protein